MTPTISLQGLPSGPHGARFPMAVSGSMSVDHVEESVCIDQIIAELGENAAEILCPRHLLRLTVREAALRLGVSDGAIKARLRARRKAVRLLA